MIKKILIVCLSLSLLFIVSRVNALEAPVDITKMSITDIQKALENGYLTSELLVKLYLERIEAYDNQFNSINQINPKALEIAKELDKERQEGNVRGALHGIPILVKNNIDVAGMATKAGSISLEDNIPINDSYVVSKLVSSGAIILGTTNMSQFAFSANDSYSSYGHVKNAFNVDYSPYGSSGGSAVALAASFASATLGTDTNSSVRIPASGAGVVGMRPSIGLVSRSGVVPYDIERDTVGVLSKNVYDNALIMDVISGEDKEDSATLGTLKYSIDSLDNDMSLDGVTIGVVTDYLKGTDKSYISYNQLTDEEIYKIISDKIANLEKSGAKIVYLDNFMTSYYLSVSESTYAGINFCDNFNEYIKGTKGTIRSFKDLVYSSGLVYDISGYLSVCGGVYSDRTERDEQRNIFEEYISGFFKDNSLDVIIYPTIKNNPFEFGKNNLKSPGSDLGSSIGYPSITIPVGFGDEGFPYGMEILAQKSQDEKLYNIANAIEKVVNVELTNTPLAPALYEVPESVTNLINVYNQLLENNEEIDKGVSFQITEFFKNYNDYDNKEEKAVMLLSLIEDMKTTNEVIKKKKINYLIISVIGVIIVIWVISLLGRKPKKKKGKRKKRK